MPRPLIALTAFIAAALLLAGGMTASWWVQSGQDAGSAPQSSIGLREARLCGSMGCTDAPLGTVERDQRWIRVGTAAHAAALLTAGLLLVMAAMVALRRQAFLVSQTTLVAVVCTGLAGLLFLWMAPRYPGMSAGYSMFAYLAGVLAGGLACMLALRSKDRGQP
jgi:hypothetical protein